MSGYLYEKDLSSMKYAILTSTRHDRMVREIADDLGIPQLRLRRYIMDQFDMLLMENLPARYEQGKRLTAEAPSAERDLKTHLYSRAVPLIQEEEMECILSRVKEMMENGTPEKEAVSAGRRLIREAILA
jgi:energy-converting hydrogenase A subunit M